MKDVRYVLPLVVIIMFNQSARAQLNECYKKVDRIVWVVEDIEHVKDGWQKLGFGTFTDHGKKKVANQSGKGSYTIKSMSASLGGLKALWVQPVKGESLYSEHLKKHGPGALAILHKVQNPEEMDSEIAVMSKQGINILQKGTLDCEDGEIQYVYFDTFKTGKYILGISCNDVQSEPAVGINKNDMRFSQVAFAINDVDPVIKYWSEKGFPEFNMVYPDGWDKEYYGKPADFQMELAFQRPGSGVAYEWCIPKVPPTVYADHIEKYGESIQHFGYNIPDMDKMLEEVKKQGLVVSQSGGWGEKGKPGSGRYAYVNMEEWGGESIELLWSFKE